MASYTDIIHQFRPFVPTLPVEAMVQVGMYKQQKYEENVTKIQGYIENLAGLDIMRPQDKDYLQSRLNEIGNNLTTVAAGDFSNFQLVNSVAGMTSQIAKDRTIQNAVASTASYKKQKELQESLRKEGKSGESNDWLFNQEVEKWYNDPTVGASFNASYSPYTNWRKNALDVLKSLTKDETITDDAFTTDSNGNLVIADAIVRKKLAGISPERVKQALMVGLTPNDFKQMEIDGRYSYSNIDNQSFANSVNESYKDKFKFFADQKTVLENAKSSTNSVVEKKKLDDQIASLDKAMKGIQSEYNSISSTFLNGDVETAKARLFTTDSLNNFSKTFANTETSLTYENSPLADMKMRREIKEMDWKKFTMDYNQKEKFHREDREDKQKERDLKAEENRLKKLELEGYGGLPGPVDPSLVPKYTLDRINSEIAAGDKQLADSESSFLARKGKDKGWLDQQRDAWERSPNSVDPEVALYFSSTEDLRRKVDGDKQIVLDANKAAVAKYGRIEDYIPKDAKGIVYADQTGRYEFTPREIVNWNSRDLQKEGYITIESPYSDNPSYVFNFEKAKKELSPKEYKLLELTKRATGTYTERPNTTKAIEDLFNVFSQYKKTVNVPYNEKLKSIMDETEKVINERLTTSQGVSYGIPTATTAQQTSIGRVLNDFANLADRTGGSLPNSPNWNSKTARELALEDKPNYSFTVVEGTERQPRAYMMEVSGKAGKVSMIVTPEQKSSVFGQMFEASPAVQAIRPYQEQIRKTGGYSTAPIPNAPTTQYNSYLSSVDFPSVGIYGVKGNLVNVGSDPRNPAKTLYTIKLAVYDPMTQSWNNDISFPRSGALTEEAIAPAMGALNDAVLYELINEKPATAKDIKNLQTASKKPL